MSTLEDDLYRVKMTDANRFVRRDAVNNIEKYINELQESKDNAYKERDLLVAALSKIFPAFMAQHPKEDVDWEDDWRTIIFIEIPIEKDKTTQVSWHIHDSEINLFKHLREGKNEWDGHDTKEKYNRLRRIKVDEF